MMGIDPTMVPFVGTPSGEKTSSALIITGPGYLCGLNINTDDTNNATIICYDSLTAANTKLWEQVVLGADITGGFFGFPPIKFTTGLYLSIAGTGASANVYTRSRGD